MQVTWLSAQSKGMRMPEMNEEGEMNARLLGWGLAEAFLACFAVLWLCAGGAAAQSAGTGALTGTVTDPSGRAVPKATVTLTNIGTSQERTATTGSDGTYSFSLLPPGNYRVKFVADGFKTAEVVSVTINVTETPALNQSLEIGTLAETVTVEGGATEALQTESSTLGTTVTNSTIEALPLSSRNYTQILSLSSGTTASVNNASIMGRGTNNMSVNGNSAGSNNFQMDGVGVNNILAYGPAAGPIDANIFTGIGIPSPDAIAEFKVQTSTYDASYGRNPGGNVNVVTKSGTNSFHGSAFEYFRNSFLNANDFFRKQIQASNGEPNHPQALNQNQFGGTIGGPIKRDKLFFFFSYQGTRSKNAVDPVTQTPNVILPDIPTGTRSHVKGSPWADALVAATCTQGSLFPPFTGLPLQCDGSNLTQVGLNIMNLPNKSSNGYLIPSPSINPNCALLFPGAFQCAFFTPGIYSENQYLANGDYLINSKQTLAMRFFDTSNPQTTNGGNFPGDNVTNQFGNTYAVLKLTSIVTNNFVNEAHVSYQRNSTHEFDTNPESLGYTNEALGIRSIRSVFGETTEPPAIISILGGFGLMSPVEPAISPTNQIQAGDQISWSHGKQVIRAGFEYEYTTYNFTFPGLEKGIFITGSLGDLLAGDVVSCLFCARGAAVGIKHNYRLPNMGGYLQDDWKATSRLTLNVGLRWEYFGMVSDVSGDLTNTWLSLLGSVPNSEVPTLADLGPSGTLCGADGTCPAASMMGQVVPDNYTSAHGNLPAPAGVLRNDSKYPTRKHPPYSSFGPRLGFAWQPLSNGKMVVRGGVGIYYDRVGLNPLFHAVEQGNPYAVTVDYSGLGQLDHTQTLFPGQYDPFPQAVPCPGPLSSCVPTPLQWQPRYFDPSCATSFVPAACSNPSFTSNLSTPLLAEVVHNPLVQQYNLGIQHEFARNWVLEIGYVGSSGINLLNAFHERNLAHLATPGNDPSGLCTGSPGAEICNSVANVPVRVPYVGYQALGIQDTEFDGSSNYNSLQVSVRHQFSHGLTLQAAYTWSKALSPLLSGAANANDPLNLAQQYGPTEFNRYHRFIVNYSYDLPFGQKAEGLTGKIISGWNVSGVTTAQTGTPMTVIDTTGGLAYGDTAFSNTPIQQVFSRAELCGTGQSVATTGSTKSRALNGWINAAAFCPPPLVPFGDPGNPAFGISPATDFGNSGSGIVTGPGQWNWDISVRKTTKLRESWSMEFRADFFNAFNHTQFANPACGAGMLTNYLINISAGPTACSLASKPPAFAVSTQTSVAPRIVQLGARFVF